MPIVGVTWEDAMLYAEWAGLQLPSEAQWEAAARGAGGSVFPWGNSIEPTLFAWARNPPGRKGPSPIGSYPAGAGPFGALDQLGNVWEWCIEAYRPEAYRERAPHAVNPVQFDPPDGPKVIRGGSWFEDDTTTIRSSLRSSVAATARRADTGFRCALWSPSKGRSS